ncbi:unnamed protein product [Polarella glacialis]|uniref:Uncharacterized protein n=1 Tax=Polarella glacialis TaxID=89957 RepID=A0A813DGF6_POLGL|nr:unnamed protein product [Polarella glacialis]
MGRARLKSFGRLLPLLSLSALVACRWNAGSLYVPLSSYWTVRRPVIAAVASALLGSAQGVLSPWPAEAVGSAPVVVGDAASQRKELKQASAALDSLVDGWDKALAGEGPDAVRLTIRAVSIREVLTALALESSDPDAFGESIEQYMDALTRADSMAYTAVFAGGSGDPKVNNSKAFLKIVLKDMKEARDVANKMLKAVS